MFKKRWRSVRRCSRSAGGVEGGVQEALEVWKEVFNKRWRSGRRCSISAGGKEGGFQEAWTEDEPGEDISDAVQQREELNIRLEGRRSRKGSLCVHWQRHVFGDKREGMHGRRQRTSLRTEGCPNS